MAVNHSPESAFATEARKWEMDYSPYGPPGRPRVYEDYPMRLYKAGRNSQGVPCIVDHADATTDLQRSTLESRGFRLGQDQALAALHQADAELAEAAANRAWHDQKMSAQAQAEAEAADALTARHLGEIPAVPVPPKKPSRSRSHRKKTPTHPSGSTPQEAV